MNEEFSNLEELRNFLKFYKNLWTILAGVSVFFPLSNLLMEVIPLSRWDSGGWIYLPARLVTVIVTVACLFAILLTFVQRKQYAAQKSRRLVQKWAILSFGSGVIALCIYIAVYYAVSEGFYWNVFEWGSDDPKRIIGDIMLLLTYSAFFVLVTRAFMLLGLLEYQGKHRKTV
ncbi:MAG: hypothetical protein HWE39_03920 [Oceanospirillaceae bacterium]|nr:hypothetical protein [Oceanospirillaceae bacterium]